MIQVFCNHFPAGQFPALKWRDGGNFINRLHTVQVHEHRHGTWYAEPVYEALFLIEKHPGMTAVVFKAFGRLCQVSVTRKWPFIDFFSVEAL